MQSDPFESLADVDVPPPPAAMQQDLHQHVNQHLTTVHGMDFVLNCLPQVLAEYSKALAAGIAFSLTGKFPK